MKQRQIIDELVEENEKLCRILQGKDLKMPSSKLEASSSGRIRKRLRVLLSARENKETRWLRIRKMCLLL